MKVLIVSHNALATDHASGKTLSSLFSGFNKDELCQLYIHGECPQDDVASFYRISDIDIINSYYKFHVYGREVVAGSSIQNDSIKKSYKDIMIENHAKEIVRDVLWSCANWFNSELRIWIDKQKPTCIFLAPGSGSFIYKIALKISEEYRLPIVSYVCDDFFFYDYRKSFFNKIWKKRLDKISEKCFRKSKLIIAICDEISEPYYEYFGTECRTVMTGSTIKIPKDLDIGAEVKNISYFGKLSLNRFLPLLKVCQEVDLLNDEFGKNIIVNIYTDKPSKEIKDAFSDVRCVRFHDFLKGQEFIDAYCSADVLLHVESFDEENRSRVMKSVSTKIADSMTSGIPLLTYAPKGIASVNYLDRNGLCIATNEAELREKIHSITDFGYRTNLHRIQLELAGENHNAKNNSLYLHQLLKEAQNINESCSD